MKLCVRTGLLALGLVVGCSSTDDGDGAASSPGSAAGTGATSGTGGGSATDGSGPAATSGTASGAGAGDGSGADGGLLDGGTSGADGGGGSLARSSGCGQPHAAGFTCVEETFAGQARRFCVAVPEGYDSQKPQTIVLGLHGCGGSPEGASNNTAPQVTAGKGSLLFVYPKALGSCWEYGGSTVDIEYVKHVLATVTGAYCVQPGRVLADGMSSGAMLTSRLVCDGVALGGAAISLNYACSKPHPMWLYGGTQDPYYGSYILPGLEGWRKTNGCSTTTKPLPQGPCVEYQGCKARTVWCTEDTGHVWPTAPWTSQIADFFATVP